MTAAAAHRVAPKDRRKKVSMLKLCSRTVALAPWFFCHRAGISYRRTEAPQSDSGHRRELSHHTADALSGRGRRPGTLDGSWIMVFRSLVSFRFALCLETIKCVAVEGRTKAKQSNAKRRKAGMVRALQLALGLLAADRKPIRLPLELIPAWRNQSGLSQRGCFLEGPFPRCCGLGRWCHGLWRGDRADPWIVIGVTDLTLRHFNSNSADY